MNGVDTATFTNTVAGSKTLSSSSIDDDFVHAVILAYDQSIPSIPGSIKEAAIKYCDDIKSSPDAYKVALTKFHQLCTQYRGADSRDEVKFFCLSTLYDTINRRYDYDMNESDRIYIRSACMVLIRDVFTQYIQANFIKNKFATIFVRIIKHDYPQHWPSLFTDLITLIQQSTTSTTSQAPSASQPVGSSSNATTPTSGGIEAIDIFLRVLKILDEEVVEHDDRRNSNEVLHNTAIKDALREHDLQSIVDAMLYIMTAYQHSKPTLVASCLDALAEYIGWIEIQYVTNSSVLTLLYSFLLNNATQLQACHCLCEIVDKRMDSSKKIALIHSIGVLDVLSKLDYSTNNSTKFVKRVAQVIAATGDQLIAAVRDIRKQRTHSNANNTVDKETNDRLLQGTSMIEQCMNLTYHFSTFRKWKVLRELIDLLNAYVHLYKNQPPASFQSHLLNMYELITIAIEYPTWYNYENKDDRENVFDEYRSLVVKLFINVVKADQQEVIVNQLSERLQDMMSHVLQRPVAEVEGALKLYYLLGEAIPKSVTTARLSTPPFESMIRSIIQSQLSQYNSSAVLIKYFEIIQRYNKIFEIHHEYLVFVLTSFLDERGIRNKNGTVAGRAAYLLYRLISSMNNTVKTHIKPVIDQLLNSIHLVIQPILTIHTPTSTMDGAATQPSTSISVEEAVLLCETMSHVINRNVVGEDNAVKYAAAIASFFRQQLEVSLQQSNILKSDDAEYKELAQGTAALVECFAAFSKPLEKEGRKFDQLWIESLELMNRVLRQFVDDDEVRNKIVVYLHRMVEILDQKLLRYLPDILAILLQQTSNTTIGVFLTLVVQLLSVYKGAFKATMDLMLLPIHMRVMQCVSTYNFIDQESSAASADAAYATEKQERLSLLKTYYSLLKTILAQGVGEILMSQRNRAQLPHITSLVLNGLVAPHDATIHKACIGILKSLITLWDQEARALQKPLLDDSYCKKLILHDITVSSFRCIFHRSFNVSNATYDSALRDLSDLQVTCAKLFPQQYPQYINEYLRTQLQLNEKAANEYVSKLTSGDDYLPLRDQLRSLVLQRQQSKQR